MDIFTEKIREQIKGLYTTLQIKLFDFISQYEQEELEQGINCMCFTYAEEVTTFILFALEKIRYIRKITPLHANHLAYIVKETKDYISYLHETINRKDNDREYKTSFNSTIDDNTFLSLNLLLIILEKLDTAEFDDFVSVGKSFLSAMYSNDMHANIDKSYIKDMTLDKATQAFILKYISPKDKKYLMTRGNKCVRRDISVMIEEIIEDECIHQVIKGNVYKSRPFIYWEDLFNTLSSIDDTGALIKFFNRAIDQISDLEVKAAIYSALNEKITNIDKDVQVRTIQVKEVHFDKSVNTVLINGFTK